MGAFQCNADLFLEIFSAPLYMQDAETHEITGARFGSVKGSGSLIISNTPAGDDVAVTQTVSSWSDTSLTFTFDQGDLLDGAVWITVTSDAAESDQVVCSLSLIFTNTLSVPAMGRDTVWNSAPCVDGDYYHAKANINVNNANLIASGYIDPAIGVNSTHDFFSGMRGCYLIGEDSGKIVELGYRDGISGGRFWWCSSGEGLGVGGSNGALVIAYVQTPWEIPSEVEADWETTYPSSYGWSDGERLIIVPKNPVSIGVTSHEDGDDLFVTDGATTLVAYAFDDLGADIAADIDWTSDLDGALGSGGSLAVELSDGTHEISAEVTSAAGQYRRADSFDLNVIGIVVTPGWGDPAGGETVSVEGYGFTVDTDVYFGANLATGLSLISSTEIECTVPAADTGVTLVDVTTETGPVTVVGENKYSYDPVDIVSISPTTGTEGTAITITGTGFTANCTVDFAGLDADNIVFVDSTEITCDAPAEDVFNPTPDITVTDTVTSSSDTLASAFTYI